MWLCIYVCIFMSLSLFLCHYLPSPTTCVCVCNSMIDVSYLIIESELGFLWKKEKNIFIANNCSGILLEVVGIV